jgi:hypothetical protein
MGHHHVGILTVVGAAEAASRLAARKRNQLVMVASLSM